MESAIYIIFVIMVSHYINKVKISRKLRSDERICQSCGKIFRYKKGRGRKPDYCNPCRINGEANKSKCKKWYYNEGWIIKRDYTINKNLQHQYNLTMNKKERKSRRELPPEEFNQDDRYWGIGETQLGITPAKNDDGSLNIEYEWNIIRNEKRRLGL